MTDFVSETTDTLVLGAGISGLGVACAMNGEGKPVTIIDSAPQVGGALQSTQKNGFLAEHGPNSLLVRDQRVSELLEKINTPPLQAHAEAKKRYIVQDGKPHPMPSSPLGMLKTPLFSLRGKMRFMIEPFIGRYQGSGEESFAEFVTRRLGREMLESAAGPFVSGIYAGNPDQLAVRHAFPRLWNLEKKYRSFILGGLAMQLGFGKDSNPHRVSPAQMVSFDHGMETLPRAMADSLPDASLHLGSTVTNITQQDDRWHITWSNETGESVSRDFSKLVLAVPHHQLGKLPLPVGLLEKLAPVSGIDSPPVTSLVLGFKREQVAHPLDGFGMLIKRAENSPLLGVLFSSSMFSGRAPDGHVTLTCMMGGMIHPEYAENSDDVVLAELQKLLGVSGQPVFRHRTSWQQAIPQYGIDYQQVLDTIKSAETTHPGLHLAGNYRGGISAGDCLVNGLELGKRLAK